MLTKISQELLFKGRSGDTRLGEWVEMPEAFPQKKDKKELIVIYGCPDDTGVTLNRGRQGAALGPDSIRKHLYKMAMPMDYEIEKQIRLVDLGNIEIKKNIIETHRNAEHIAEKISQNNCTLIALGGGHDYAAPNFTGWAKGKEKKSKLGLINVDPHLDMRSLENGQPNSGTPFRQILESKIISGKNFTEFGIRTNRNAREHFSYALKNKVSIFTLDSLREKNAPLHAQFKKELSRLSKLSTNMAVTLDIDSYSEGEGSSASPVIGFTGNELYEFAKAAGREKKVSYFEIAEVAPPLDPSERTSRLAAELVFSFIYSRAKSKALK